MAAKIAVGGTSFDAEVAGASDWTVPLLRNTSGVRIKTEKHHADHFLASGQAAAGSNCVFTSRGRRLQFRALQYTAIRLWDHHRRASSQRARDFFCRLQFRALQYMAIRLWDHQASFETDSTRLFSQRDKIFPKGDWETLLRPHETPI